MYFYTIFPFGLTNQIIKCPKFKNEIKGKGH